MCLCSSLIGIMKNADDISTLIHIFPLRVYSRVSRLTNCTCFGNIRISFNSLKSKQILYNCAFCFSLSCISDFVFDLNSPLPVGLGTKTTLLLHSESDSLTTPASSNCLIAFIANWYFCSGNLLTLWHTFLCSTVSKSASYMSVISMSSLDFENLSSNSSNIFFNLSKYSGGHSE